MRERRATEMTGAKAVRDERNVSALVLLQGLFVHGHEARRRPGNPIGRRQEAVVVVRPGFEENLKPDDRFSNAGEAIDAGDTVA